jgi:DNA processing protein
MIEELLPWFSLKSVPGIGNLLFKRLIDRFHSPKRVFSAHEKDLSQIDGLSQQLVSSIKNYKVSGQIYEELNRVSKKNYKIVRLTDIEYPPLLLHIPDPPPFLYVSGNLDNLLKSISVVGSRNATAYGISITKKLCSDLAALNMTVVSGMARGIDTAAHEGALAGKGRTIAVLGSGLENIYPAENRKLFHRISENGAVISEFPLMSEPDARNFPIRNRIISGMSLGTVVVEATKKSGSLITARLAAEQNREVFAIPGSIQSFKSVGTHTLIKEGAKLVEHAQDIVEELPYQLQADNLENNKKQNWHDKKAPYLTTDESIVVEAIEPYPIHIDDLAKKISMESGKLSGILLQLELKGIIQQSPGKLFSLESK